MAKHGRVSFRERFILQSYSRQNPEANDAELSQFFYEQFKHRIKDKTARASVGDGFSWVKYQYDLGDRYRTRPRWEVALDNAVYDWYREQEQPVKHKEIRKAALRIQTRLNLETSLQEDLKFSDRWILRWKERYRIPQRMKKSNPFSLPPKRPRKKKSSQTETGDSPQSATFTYSELQALEQVSDQAEPWSPCACIFGNLDPCPDNCILGYSDQWV